MSSHKSVGDRSLEVFHSAAEKYNPSLIGVPMKMPDIKLKMFSKPSSFCSNVLAVHYNLFSEKKTI